MPWLNTADHLMSHYKPTTTSWRDNKAAMKEAIRKYLAEKPENTNQDIDDIMIGLEEEDYVSHELLRLLGRVF